MEYFSELFGNKNKEGSPEILIQRYTEEQQLMPDENEILSVIFMMKNNKSPGEDGITAELFQNGGREFELSFVKLIQNIWRNEEMPEDWKSATFIPIHKKGDKTVCGNYRGIALLNVAYKVLSKLIASRMTKIMENNVGEYQGGFRKGKSTSNQIFILRTILEKCYEYNVDLHLLFIDYKQAYDSIDRKVLIETLIQFYVPRKLIRLIQMTLTKNKGKVTIQGEMTDEFEIGRGVRQGDALSTILFNIVLERVVRNISINPGGTIFNRMVQIMAYADDVVLISRSIQEMKTSFIQLEEESTKMGLRVNETKTKYMIATREENRWKQIDNIAIQKYKFERVRSFKYLGSVITEDNVITEEIKERLQAGNKCYWALLPLMKSNNLSKNNKKKIYRTVIKPVVTYASETWCMLKSDERRIATWERKILRRIYGPKVENDEWKMRTNREIYELYGEPQIIGDIKGARLRWVGHVERSEEESLLQKIYKGKPGGRRCVGRPRKKWIENIEEDLKELGIRGWRRKTQDRREWASIVRQAQALQGP